MKKISIILMVLVAALASCKKTPEVNLKYVDVERDLVTVGTTTANIQCDYDYIATLKKAYLYYGEGENEDDFTSAEMRVVQNTLYVDLAGLKENTTYSYYYEFVNGFNSMRSKTKTFKTEAAPVEVVLPTVITAEVTEIAENSAKGGGEVTDDGGAEVTERGICWSTNANPTLSDNHIAAGSGLGEFTALMDGLEANTTYHMRAYAINAKGTAYGLDREFTTLSGGGSGNAPIGAINGLFTINENGDQVYFSQGNLQYQASTNTWRFAENQWDYVGDESHGTVYEAGVKCNNKLISSTYDGWIDCYGWGTSGWDNGNIYYQPFDNSHEETVGFGYGPIELPVYPYHRHDLAGDYANADWGVYNAIVNGGNTTNTWRTLSFDEWKYVFNNRVTLSGVRYARAIVNGVNGVILFPDNWDTSNYPLNNTNDAESVFSTNEITENEWSILELIGAVFLPAAGGREGHVSTYCHYWTSSFYNIYYAIDVTIGDGSFFFLNEVCYGGETVRLVNNANSTPTPPTPPSGEHEYVDLGLPSGTLWATCNVGANSPEEYGDYFAWGETEPKDCYNTSTYQYIIAEYNLLTKYCNEPGYGYNDYTDDLIVLLPEDDAATANWGEDWRTPTKEEWDELLSNTDITRTNWNGVLGYSFASSNGNSLFIPAAGYHSGAGLHVGGMNYWSSSLYLEDACFACMLHYLNPILLIGPAYYRWAGCSVRAVRSSH